MMWFIPALAILLALSGPVRAGVKDAAAQCAQPWSDPNVNLYYCSRAIYQGRAGDLPDDQLAAALYHRDIVPAVGERRDLWVALTAIRDGVDLELRTRRRAGRVEALAENAKAAAVLIGRMPDHHEAAIAMAVPGPPSLATSGTIERLHISLCRMAYSTCGVGKPCKRTQ